MVPDAGNKKRRGFGGFLSSKPAAETEVPSNYSQLPVAPANNASNNTASSGNTHITPIENHGQVSNVSEQRNLAVNERTGEVIDDDTGEVLTVTTTTTTVTKTETRRGRSPQPPPSGSNAFVQAQTVSETTQQRQLGPSSALQPPSTNPSLQSRTSNDTFSQQSNSFTSSSNSALQQVDSGPYQQKSARENLKSAATGLQDVRNSLRGTLNTSEMAVPRRNPARGSRVQQAPPMQQVPPVPPIPSSAPVLPQLQTGTSHWQAPWPEPTAETIEEEDVGGSDRLKKRKSLSSMPASFSPESNGQLEREKSPRLFKRSRNKNLVA